MCLQTCNLQICKPTIIFKVNLILKYKVSLT